MSFGVPELILVVVIVLLLFGTKKLKTLGGDLGSAIKGFRSALGSADDKSKISVDQEPQLKDVSPETATQEKVEATKEK